MSATFVNGIHGRNKAIAALRYIVEWLGLGRRHVQFVHGHRRLPFKNQGSMQREPETLFGVLSQCLSESEKPPDVLA